MIARLDTEGDMTWRMWSRMLTRTLPTNHKMSVMANRDDDNIYHWVYGDELGEHGKCRRSGCQQESETTKHAVCECVWAQQRWKQLDASLSMEWSLHNEDWDKVSWISNTYEGWDNMWTALGAVPEGIEKLEGNAWQAGAGCEKMRCDGGLDLDREE